MNNDIINFDNSLFLNREGLNKIGITPADSEAVYTYLLTQHKMHDGVTGCLFINSIINVRLKRWYFEKVKLLIHEPLTAAKFYVLCKEFRKEMVGKYTYVPFKLSGFFEVGKRRQIGKNYFFELRPINNAYASSRKINAPFSFDVLENDLTHEQESGITLLHKPNLSDSENLKRIEAELFFSGTDLVEAIKHQVTGFDPANVGPLSARKFEKGEEVKDIAPIEKLPGESPLVIATLERIIAALFWVLQNEKRPKFDTQESIYSHLEKHFTGIKGLKGNYIKDFIKPASDKLREREEEKGIYETYLSKIK